MLRSQAGRLHSLLQTSDVALSALVFLALLQVPGMVRSGGGPQMGLLVMGLVASLAWPLLLDHIGLYDSQRRAPLGGVVARLLASAAVVIAALAGTAIAFQLTVDPIFAVACGVGQVAVLTASRAAIFGSLRMLRRSGRNYRNVIIVGTGPRGRHALEVVESHPEWGLRVSGFLDEFDSPVDETLVNHRIHKLVDFPDLLRNEVVDEVVVACPRGLLTAVEPAVALCAAVGVPVTVFSDLFGDYMPAPRATRFGPVPALSFGNAPQSKAKLWVKRGVDIVGATLLLAASAPVLAAAAVAIRVTSPGSIFFRQERCGLNGRRFFMIKLRTMCADAESRLVDLEGFNEQEGPVFKMRDDPRITPVGRVLRRYSIDELPQLINVLVADMSLVGPRPPLPREVEQYEDFQRRRLSMRPGLTCLWQVNGRSDISFEDWVRLDLEYIDGWSLGQDLKILLKTVPAVLRGTGAS